MPCAVDRIPGATLQVGLFAVDPVCGGPVFGLDMGYITDCADVVSEPITETTRDAILMTCPTGDVLLRRPAVTKVVANTVTVRLVEIPTEFMVAIGAVEPIMQSGVLAGWRDCGAPVNLAVYTLVENMAADGCAPGSAIPPALLRVDVITRATISTDGDRGTSDFRFTIVGETVQVDLGSGFVPFAYDPLLAPAQWPTECVVSCVNGWQDAVASIGSCGLVDTVAGPACTPAS